MIHGSGSVSDRPRILLSVRTGYGSGMEAVLRWRDGHETEIVVAEPPPSKIEQDGRHFRLARGTKRGDGPVVAIYDEIRDDDR